MCGGGVLAGWIWYLCFSLLFFFLLRFLTAYDCSLLPFFTVNDSTVVDFQGKRKIMFRLLDEGHFVYYYCSLVSERLLSFLPCKKRIPKGGPDSIGD